MSVKRILDEQRGASYNVDLYHKHLGKPWKFSQGLYFSANKSTQVNIFDSLGSKSRPILHERRENESIGMPLIFSHCARQKTWVFGAERGPGARHGGHYYNSSPRPPQVVCSSFSFSPHPLLPWHRTLSKYSYIRRTRCPTSSRQIIVHVTECSQHCSSVHIRVETSNNQVSL